MMKKPAIEQEIRDLSDFEESLSSFIDHVVKSGKPLVLTKAGKSKVVLLDIKNYEALIEELELLRDIHIAEEQIQSGDYLSNEEARKRMMG